jgi:hypothetical protein
MYGIIIISMAMAMGHEFPYSVPVIEAREGLRESARTNITWHYLTLYHTAHCPPSNTRTAHTAHSNTQQWSMEYEVTVVISNSNKQTLQ